MKTNIVASGYSLKGFDFDSLEGHTIVINHVWRYCKHDFIVGLDNPLKTDWGVGVDLTKVHTNEAHRIEECVNYKKQGRGLNRNEGFVSAEYHGSLFAAINIALNMGFKELHIYGADGKLTDGYMHFFDDKPLPPHIAQKKTDMLVRFNRYIEAIKKQLFGDERMIFY